MKRGYERVIGGNQPITTTMDARARNVVVESGEELIINGKLSIGQGD